jgi:hypothetical protein
MDIPWRIALVVVAAAFLGFLLAKMWPRASDRAGSPAAISAARKRAHDAKTPRERATALCDAADAALAFPFGTMRAAAYYFRAMRADPTWAGSIDRAAAGLGRRRARTLEKMFWRRLAATKWDAEHATATRALVSRLAAVYAATRGHAAQAQVLARLLAGETLPPAKK